MCSIIPQKTCSKCKQEFPQTGEHFSPDKTNKKTGLKAYCKRCGSEMSIRYYEKHRVEVLEKKRVHRIENHDAYVERDRQRYQDTIEYQHQRHADYRQRNREKRRISRRNWYVRNMEHAKAYARQYHQEHIEERRAYARNYYRSHYEERIAYAKSYNAGRRALEAAQGKGYTAAEVRLQHRSQHGKCWHCGKLVGRRYHVDHLIPLRKGGKHDASNIVIACPLCNLSKKDKLCYQWNGRLF